MEFNGGTCFHLAASVPREHTLELNVPKITQLQSQLQFSIIEQFEEKKWESGTLLEPNSMSLSASFSPCTPIGFAATSLLSLSSGPKSVCKRKLVFANDKNKNSFVCPPQDFILNLMSLNQTEAFVALGLLFFFTIFVCLHCFIFTYSKFVQSISLHYIYAFVDVIFVSRTAAYQRRRCTAIFNY